VCAVAVTAAVAASVRGAAAPPLSWGVADDYSKYADDGGAWFDQQLKGANLVENRWTLAWDPTNPTAIKELPFLQRAAPVAQANGVHVVLALYAGANGTSIPDPNSHDPAAFCTWAKSVAQTVKQWGIRDFIVWNEPNSTKYWAPQKDGSGNDVAAPAYEALLAQCYDALHSLDGGGWAANVIGMGLAAKAATTSSNQPLAFLRDVGAAYKASGRTKPIMDQLALHPYPLPAAAPSPDKGYTNTPDAYGPPDLDRVKQAVYDAFNGTGQPTTLNGLTFRLDEFGWQTQESGAPYTGTENAGPPGSAPAVSEQTQSQYLAQAAQRFACDPTVTDVELFLLVDETDLAGWQSGLLTAGGPGVSRPKPAYGAVGPIFGLGRSACVTGMTSWTPAGAGTQGSSGGTQSGSAGGPVLDLGNLGALGLQNAQQVNQQLIDQIDRVRVTLSLSRLLFQQVFGGNGGTGLGQALSQFDGLLEQLEQTLAGAATSQTRIDQAAYVIWVSSPGDLTGALNALTRLNLAAFERRIAAHGTAHAARVRVVAKATGRIAAAGSTMSKLRPVKGAKLGAGTYALVYVAQPASDHSKSIGVAVPLATVKKKAHTTRPLCKKGHRSTKKHPCRKPRR
jgi:HPt (histidine-containing phosphotransfer) domain-containing protein